MRQISNSKPKAIKDHRCDYCNQAINKGDTYDSQTNTYEGTIYTWKAHLSCSKLTNDLNMFDEISSGVTDGDFQDFVNEKYHDLCIDELIEDNGIKFNDRLKILKDYFNKKQELNEIEVIFEEIKPKNTI